MAAHGERNSHDPFQEKFSLAVNGLSRAYSPNVQELPLIITPPQMGSRALGLGAFQLLAQSQTTLPVESPCWGLICSLRRESQSWVYDLNTHPFQQFSGAPGGPLPPRLLGPY